MNKTNVNDQKNMNDILNSTKAECGLFMNGTLESNTMDVHQTFKMALDEVISIQNQVFKAMEAKGWYSLQNVDETKIETTKQKFEQPSCC